MPETPNGNTIQWRLIQLEGAVRTLDIEKADMKEVIRISDDLKTLKRAALTLAFGLPVSGVTFLLGVLALVGNHH